MVERLFLDGVDSERARPCIDVAYESSAVVSSAMADASLAVCDATMVGAEWTLYLSVVKPLIISTFHI